MRDLEDTRTMLSDVSPRMVLSSDSPFIDTSG